MPHGPNPTRSLPAALFAAGLALFCAAPAALAAPVWYALDGAPPGTPPSLVLLPSSSPAQTDLDITIHGFYFETASGAGQPFLRITLDRRRDGAAYRMAGRPELPALHHTLGSLLGAPAGAPTVQVLDEVTIPGASIYPVQPPFSTNDPAPPFQWDQAFYSQTNQPYPSVHAIGAPSLGRLAGLALVGAESYPIRVVPATQTMMVARHYRISVPHSGSGLPTTHTVTRRLARRYAGLLDNQGVLSPYRPENLFEYTGDYLILSPLAFLAEANRLAEQKRRRGFEVTVATTDTVGTLCGDVTTCVSDWWSAHTDRDHYALLLGDEELIHTCVDATFSSSDRVFARVDGADYHVEVFLGRLPCSTLAECSEMVGKVLDYEDGYPGWFVGRVDLVASNNEPGKDFTAVMEDVRTATYAVTPTFETFYGGAPKNHLVVDAVNDGVGIVAYVGHGEVSEWSNWCGASFDLDTLGTVANGSSTPLVCGFACLTARFDQPDDGLGESWLLTDERAVAYYGATALTNFGYVELLIPDLFAGLYGENDVFLGDALEAAVDPLIDHWGPEFGIATKEGEYNAGMYVLFGDPDMKVWREAPDVPLIGGYPGSVPPDPGSVDVHVESLPGPGAARAAGGGAVPIPQAIVSLYKPGEFQVNRYTDAQGDATLPIVPTSPGWIYVTVYTEFDSRAVARDSIEVMASSGAAPPFAAGWRLEAPRPNPFRDRVALSFDLPRAGPARLRVMDVGGRVVSTLVDGVLPSGRHAAGWNGLDQRGAPAAPGLYFVRLESGGRALTRKVLRARLSSPERRPAGRRAAAPRAASASANIARSTTHAAREPRGPAGDTPAERQRWPISPSISPASRAPTPSGWPARRPPTRASR